MPPRGQHHTEEAKRKISDAHWGMKKFWLNGNVFARKAFISPEELRRLFVDEKQTREDIGKQLGVCGGTVARWLKVYGIKLEARQLKKRIRPERQHRFKGHTWTNNGYLYLLRPDHPRAVKGYVQEHRLMIEDYLGRPLIDGENVHHLSLNKKDNRIENFILFSSNAEHTSFHHWLNLVGAYHLGLAPAPADLTYDHPVLVSGKWVTTIGISTFLQVKTASRSHTSI